VGNARHRGRRRGGGDPDSVFETLEELWRIISEYVFADEYEEALQVAREATNRWQRSVRAADGRRCPRLGRGHHGHQRRHHRPVLLNEGLAAAQTAVRERPNEPRNWESIVSLLIASSRTPDALAAVDQAERATGGKVSSMLCMLRARVAVSMGRADDAMTAIVRAVSRAEPAQATAVRSEATDLLVGWAGQMLPIKSAAELNRYVEMVDVAAWCSNGVPEAEDMVRLHRMWAANAVSGSLTAAYECARSSPSVPGSSRCRFTTISVRLRCGRCSWRALARASPRTRSCSWRLPPTCRPCTIFGCPRLTARTCHRQAARSVPDERL